MSLHEKATEWKTARGGHRCRTHGGPESLMHLPVGGRELPDLDQGAGTVALEPERRACGCDYHIVFNGNRGIQFLSNSHSASVQQLRLRHGARLHSRKGWFLHSVGVCYEQGNAGFTSGSGR